MFATNGEVEATGCLVQLGDGKWTFEFDFGNSYARCEQVWPTKEVAHKAMIAWAKQIGCRFYPAN